MATQLNSPEDHPHPLVVLAAILFPPKPQPPGVHTICGGKLPEAHREPEAR